MPRHLFVFAFAFALLASCGGKPPPPPPRQPTAHSRPSWCERALGSIPDAATISPRDVAPANAAAAEALARRMNEEFEVFVTLGDHEVLQNVAQVANDVSAAAWMLASRIHVDLGDRVSVEHALAVMLRKRERAHIVLRGYCNEVAPPAEPSNEWRERAFAYASTLQPAMRSCREGAPADERPTRLHVLLDLDPSGHVTLAAPVDVTFEPNRWGPTDTAYCIVQRLEATQFPESGARVTLLLQFAAVK